MTLVLVVDDVPALAEQYAYDLRRIGGYEVVTAATGEKALELIAADAVDCVVLDLEMPGMDGFDVLRALERKGSQVPVIVYTGTGRLRSLRPGASGWAPTGSSTRPSRWSGWSTRSRPQWSGGGCAARSAALRRQLGRETLAGRRQRGHGRAAGGDRPGCADPEPRC